MERDSQDLKSYLNGPDKKSCRLSLTKAFAIATMTLNNRSVSLARKATGGLIPVPTLTKWSNLKALRMNDNTREGYAIRMRNRQKALEIKNSVNHKLNELESLIANTKNKGEREALQIIQAELTQKIDIKQKALSDEINNQLFRILEIVEKRLRDDGLPSCELIQMMSVLKDSAAIVGLIGRTPLIAQQFNSIHNAQTSNDEDTKIKAIEVEIIDNEAKD